MFILLHKPPPSLEDNKSGLLDKKPATYVYGDLDIKDFMSHLKEVLVIKWIASLIY